ncbi:MAG: nucleotide exchange factor GrpE [Actinobacteria bacterium]|nr:nucleotide exchange factor GrpE [Actinomycetota bacterium]
MSDSVVTEESGVDENVDSTESQENTQESVKSAEEVLTEDLQRLQADYSNYRKRVDRDRAVAYELAVASVLNELLPILDDLDRARIHGELEGGFKSVADQIENAVTKIGLVKFGEAGTPFDPQIHEALMHLTSTEVTEVTATEILQKGYKYKERVLRPARVTVTDPE